MNYSSLNTTILSELGLILFSRSRVQTRTSTLSLGTLCPAGSISLWPLMTRCPCRQRLSPHTCPLWKSPFLNFQEPRSFLDCYVSASASPPSLSTWRPPERRRRSRGTSLTLGCRGARTANTSQKPGPLDGTAICSLLCYFPLPSNLLCPAQMLL